MKNLSNYVEDFGKSHTFASITSNFQNHFAWYNLVISDIRRGKEISGNNVMLKLEGSVV